MYSQVSNLWPLYSQVRNLWPYVFSGEQLVALDSIRVKIKPFLPNKLY